MRLRPVAYRKREASLPFIGHETTQDDSTDTLCQLRYWTSSALIRRDRTFRAGFSCNQLR